MPASKARIWIAVIGVAAGVAAATLWQFRTDLQAAGNRTAAGGIVMQPPCGVIEYADTGTGTPLLAVHSSGGGYGTYAWAEYTAAGIASAHFMGFDTGGHVWLGHNDAVMNAIADLILAPEQAAER